MLRDLRLRLLEPRDEQALATLFAANDVPAVTRWFDPFPLSAASAGELANHRGRDLHWGVWSGSDIVGFAMVRGWDGGYPQPAYGYFVDRAQHRQGLGAAATALVIEELRRLGVPEVRARVHEGNEASLRTLLAAGFTELRRGDGRVLLTARPGSIR
jgi:RimJ/RimL family protein N-acetyltransferase